MSCIAVNIQEAKREVVRIDLKEPLHGKNGDKQAGKFINVDTGEEVMEIVLKRRGFYEHKTLWLGQNLTGVLKQGHATYQEMTKKTVKDDETCFYMDNLIFIDQENYKIPFGPFVKLHPNTQIDHYYLTFTFLDA